VSEGVLLLVGSGKQQLRERGLRSIAARYEVALLVPHKVTWEREYVGRSLIVDFEDEDLFRSEGERFAKAVGATGLLTWSDRVGERCARLAQSLAMPFADPVAMRACKDKRAFRTRLEGLPGLAVRASLVHDLSGAREAAREIGYPVVLKPRALGGSIGVVRVDSERELEQRLRIASSASAGGLTPIHAGVVVEEYLDGEEFCVDCVTFDSETIPVAVYTKRQCPEPYFEPYEISVPAPASPEIAAAVAVVTRAHSALGLDNLATHAELRLTTRGPRLIELNARIAGAHLPWLAELALGLDLPLAAADVAMGRVPDLRTEQRCVAAIRYLFPEFDMRLQSVELHGTEHAGLVAFGALADEGAELRRPPRGFMSLYGYAIVTGASREECTARLDGLEPEISVRGTAI
jgi:biotin carboxylase